MKKHGPITDCGCPPERGHEDRCSTLTALTWPDGEPKIAPVQGYERGIPWSVQLAAYDAYVVRWSRQAALIDLDRRGCRGGFGVKELDDLLPDWRSRVSDLNRLQRKIDELTAELALREREKPQVPALIYWLGLMVEEMGEALQWIGKSLRFGYETPGRKGPDGAVTGETPRDLLPPELGDVCASILFGSHHGFVDAAYIADARDAKVKRLLDPDARDNLGRQLAPQPSTHREPVEPMPLADHNPLCRRFTSGGAEPCDWDCGKSGNGLA